MRPEAKARRGPPKTKRRSPGPVGRVNKKTGDVRSKPDKGKRDLAGAPGPDLDAEATEEAAEDAPAPRRPLSGKATRHLRALGHHLDAIVQIGKEGITDAVVRATREALRAHELVKVRVGAEAPVDRKEAGAELAELAGAQLAQTLGRVLLLYKRHPHKPKIVLPR